MKRLECSNSSKKVNAHAHTAASYQHIFLTFTTFSNKRVTLQIVHIHLLLHFAKYSIKEVTMAINTVSITTAGRAAAAA